MVLPGPYRAQQQEIQEKKIVVLKEFRYGSFFYMAYNKTTKNSTKYINYYYIIQLYNE